MNDAILPKPRTPLIDWRRLLPDITHLCCCGAPLFYADEPHDCALVKRESLRGGDS